MMQNSTTTTTRRLDPLQKGLALRQSLRRSAARRPATIWDERFIRLVSRRQAPQNESVQDLDDIDLYDT